MAKPFCKEFKLIYRFGKDKVTFSAQDASCALGISMEKVDSTIQNMLIGKFLIRVSTGLYRLRGVV